jgi:hypothetical protein
MLPPPSLSDLEGCLDAIQDAQISQELSFLVNKAINKTLSDREFGSFCGEQVSKKMRGEVPGINWNAYSNAVYIAGCLIKDARK